MDKEHSVNTSWAHLVKLHSDIFKVHYILHNTCSRTSYSLALSYISSYNIIALAYQVTFCYYFIPQILSSGFVKLLFFKYPQMKKSRGVKSGEWDGHSASLFSEMTLS